jgi:hypothetical protein
LNGAATPSAVIAGLDPAIQHSWSKTMDARVKPGQTLRVLQRHRAMP